VGTRMKTWRGRLGITATRVPIRTTAGGMRMTSAAIFISYASIFCPGTPRSANHQPGHEDGDEGKYQHPVQPRPDAP